MDRTERLLDLVALLLDSKEPISWAEIRDAFPEDYKRGTDEATERKFERDKAELLELGIPITYIQADDEKRDGYLVDRESYYLPEVGLGAEEVAVLYAAGSAALASGAFPAQQDLAHALRKIGFYAGKELPTPKVRMEFGEVPSRELATRLDDLWAAAASRKWVEISYFAPQRGDVTRRRVDPYGLALRQGIWSMVGFCHLRQDIRTFHVQRIREHKVNTARPRSPDFEVPDTFKLDDYVASHPWQYRFHEPYDVELQMFEDLVALGANLFPGARVEGDRVFVATRYLDGLCRYALSLSPNCRVLGPEKARTRFVEMARLVLGRHQDRKAVAGGSR